MGEPKATTTAKVAGAIGATLFILTVVGVLAAGAAGLLPWKMVRSADPASPQPAAGAPPATSADSAPASPAATGAPGQAEPAETERKTIPVRSPEPTLAATLAPDLRAEVVAVIEQANEAQTLAYKTSDIAPLLPYYADDLLEEERSLLEQNRAQNTYEERALTDQQFLSFSASPDGQRVQVEVLEIWDNAFYNATSKSCTSRSNNITLVQTVFLERRDARWLIVKITYQQESFVLPEPCG